MRKVWKIGKWIGLFLVALRVMRDLITIPDDWETAKEMAANIEPYIFPFLSSDSLILGAVGFLFLSFLAVDLGPSVKKTWGRFRGDDLEFVYDDGFPYGEMQVWKDEQDNLTIRQIRRVGIRNNSGNTIHNVRVRLETMRGPKDFTYSVNAELPQNLSPRGKSIATIDLADGETGHWDVARFWENKTKNELSDIFICCADKAAGHHFHKALYKADVSIYSDELPKHEKEFAFGVTEDNELIFMSWENWLRLGEKNVSR